MNRPIKIWRFYEAPVKYKKLSEHGGGEDWIALVPREMWEKECNWIGFLEEGSCFGCCSISIHTLKNGDIIKIGTHA